MKHPAPNAQILMQQIFPSQEIPLGFAEMALLVVRETSSRKRPTLSPVEWGGTNF